MLESLQPQFCVFPLSPINLTAVQPVGLKKDTLTPVFSVACSLSAFLKQLSPFILNTLQPLFQNTRGGWVSRTVCGTPE